MRFTEKLERDSCRVNVVLRTATLEACVCDFRFDILAMKPCTEGMESFYTARAVTARNIPLYTPFRHTLQSALSQQYL
jgi:hypothetical protein